MVRDWKDEEGKGNSYGLGIYIPVGVRDHLIISEIPFLD